jgi:hypothetical protein
MIKLREQIEVEEKKMEQFNQWVESWEKAERLRRFIAAYAEKTSKWGCGKVVALQGMDRVGEPAG